ncbi:hypothetical protein BO79DRAFT_211055 [Aspergillus costaricaensis CBS 115574]|uniref:Uncharacterized protein n=1 Tax=Aspergillus costaricaensis CBS 115574 TaxID=1448317 RepID=A0ACD1I3T5_9EURO|nr:hypothetical protein BO79DRAFT_211055 [Aspergillus costaricaensis CBS 115574]RAK85158.1 hypothetical protein BO79DRAFT_211055 [Aspergillus costaricaensis CBS 115574]
MNADKKPTTSTLPSSSSSQRPTSLQRIARSPWTLLHIVLFTASLRYLWSYMQWPKGGDMALSLNTALTILYIIVRRYVDD